MSVFISCFAASPASSPAQRVGDRRKISLILSALLAGVCLTATSADAGTVVPAAQGTIYADDASSNSFGAVHDKNCVPDFGCWDATATTSTNLVATATASATDQAAAIASGLVSYAFVVNGPADVVVPLTIRGFVSAATSGVRAEAHAVITYSGRSFTACSSTGPGCGDLPASGFLIDSFSSLTDTVNWIAITANGTVYNNGAFSSFADPIIAIDPLFRAANPGFSLSFSPNLGGAVPEPGTWALMLVGVGVAMRSSRRRLATA